MYPWLTFRASTQTASRFSPRIIGCPFGASTLSASGIAPARLPLFPNVLSVPAGHFHGGHRRASPGQYEGSPVPRVGLWGFSWQASRPSRFTVKIRLPLPWLGSSLERSSRRTVEPLRFDSWRRSPLLVPLPASIRPLVVAGLNVKEPGEGPRRRADLVGPFLSRSFFARGILAVGTWISGVDRNPTKRMFYE